MVATQTLELRFLDRYGFLPAGAGKIGFLASPRLFHWKPVQGFLQEGHRRREYLVGNQMRAAGRHPTISNARPDRGSPAHRSVGKRPRQRLGLRRRIADGHVPRTLAVMIAGMVKVTPSHQDLAGIRVMRTTRDMATGGWAIRLTISLFRSQLIT